MHAMTTTERGETAATREPGGPHGPVDVSWLILERLGDLKEQIADLRADVKALDAKVDSQGKELRADIDNLRNYIVIPVVLVLLAAILAHFVPGL